MTGDASAERLEFAAGGVVDLPATVQGEIVRVEAPEGVYEFPREDCARIEPGEASPREWAARASRAMSGGAPERIEAARWALDRGLVAEAVAMVHAAGASDPTHPTTSRMLAALERLAAPLPDPDLSPTLAALGGTFRVVRGSHLVLLHQHDDAEATRRVEFLEGVFTGFYLEFAALGFELPAPRRKLLSAWFAEREDYRAFLRSEDAEAFLNTRGYHHPTRRLVVAYDSRSDPSYRRSAESLARSMPKGDRLRRERDRQRLLLEESRRRLELGTASHELVHQLVSASRLALRHEDFPRWLHEGLAMQFEAVRGDRWAGLGTSSPFRLEDWDAMHPEPSLAALLTDAGFARGYHQRSYAHAWAFVFFLRNDRPAEFVRLLDGCRMPGHEARGKEELARLAGLEAEFLDAMRPGKDPRP
jgi:hypothetical protein